MVQLTFADMLLRITVATLCGGIIGIERGRKHRAAGFRTYMIVCMGAALTMVLSTYLCAMISGVWTEVPENAKITDVSRFGAQVINGSGFLGAGTVLVTGKQEVKGLTTAAGLWASACMGIAIGAGFYECVLLAFFLIFLCSRVFPYIESAIVENARNINIYIEFDSMDNVSQILSCIKAVDTHIYEVEIDRGRQEQYIHPNATVTLRLNKRKTHAKLMLALSELECIHAVEEI